MPTAPAFVEVGPCSAGAPQEAEDAAAAQTCNEAACGADAQIANAFEEEERLLGTPEEAGRAGGMADDYKDLVDGLLSESTDTGTAAVECKYEVSLSSQTPVEAGSPRPSWAADSGVDAWSPLPGRLDEGSHCAPSQEDFTAAHSDDIVAGLAGPPSATTATAQAEAEEGEGASAPPVLLRRETVAESEEEDGPEVRLSGIFFEYRPFRWLPLHEFMRE
mmetsp:Transcript_24877/g.77334  ORF Transcript_24877/g.77334 Transcript_24877/m.77334 type:complete len:219 (-) Transcript_24877:148-804(-)